jgi:hypothetical protein
VPQPRELDPAVLNFMTAADEAYTKLVGVVATHLNWDDERRQVWVDEGAISFGHTDSEPPHQSRLLYGPVRGADSFRLHDIAPSDTGQRYRSLAISLRLFCDSSPFLPQEDLGTRTNEYSVVTSHETLPIIINAKRASTIPRPTVSRIHASPYARLLTGSACTAIVSGLYEAASDIDLDTLRRTNNPGSDAD